MRITEQRDQIIKMALIALKKAQDSLGADDSAAKELLSGAIRAYKLTSSCEIREKIEEMAKSLSGLIEVAEYGDDAAVWMAMYMDINTATYTRGGYDEIL